MALATYLSKGAFQVERWIFKGLRYRFQNTFPKLGTMTENTFPMPLERWYLSKESWNGTHLPQFSHFEILELAFFSQLKPCSLFVLPRIFPSRGTMADKKARKKPGTKPVEKVDRFLSQVARAGLPTPETEFQFLVNRKWRFDYAWPDLMLALEREGGAWVAGRHTRGKGFQNDLQKYLAATVAGWTVLRVDLEMIETGQAIQATKAVLDRFMEGLAS
jgi:hypothetical protein